ncbi:MAG: hypothetical protein IPN38_20075 [Flavobacteriales bacterium]|nr:hypothetical protein [Flavobacteriales bacterium]
MSTFLRRLALFLVVLGLVAWGLDRTLKAGLRARTTFTLGVWNRLVDGKIQADVLFCGSSRALMHFDAATIGKATGRSCYNIGMDGNQLNHQLPWLITYLKYNRPPELIIQNVDMISLSPDTDVFFPSQYPPYLSEDAIYEDLRNTAPDWWKDRYIPLYSFTRFGYGYAALGVKGLLGLEDTLHDPLHFGFQRKDLNWDGGFDQFKKRFPKGLRRFNEESARNTLRAIIRTAQEKGSKVVLVYTPELGEMQRLTLNREEVMDVYRSIAAESGIPFWDFSTATFCEDRNYFYNSQHLNARGVDLFTPMIADSIAAYVGNKP